MRIEDHTSGCVAHMAVLAGKLWFLGKSRSIPLCMGEWVGRGCCLARLCLAFRELSNTWKLLGVDGPFGKTLVLVQWGYENCQEMRISCWNRLYGGTLFRLAFYRLCRVKGVGGRVRIEDHTSGCVAHMSVLARKLWFLGKSKSNQLCMGE